ncbi:MAG: hypothetical protein AB7S67_10175 [Thiomonas sp.]
MHALLDLQLAHLILAVHLGVIVFNVAGLVGMPPGAWRRVRRVRGCFAVIYRAVGNYTLALWWWGPPRCGRVRVQPSSKAIAASSTSGQSP